MKLPYLLKSKMKFPPMQHGREPLILDSSMNHTWYRGAQGERVHSAGGTKGKGCTVLGREWGRGVQSGWQHRGMDSRGVQGKGCMEHKERPRGKVGEHGRGTGNEVCSTGGNERDRMHAAGGGTWERCVRYKRGAQGKRAAGGGIEGNGQQGTQATRAGQKGCEAGCLSPSSCFPCYYLSGAVVGCFDNTGVRTYFVWRKA